uniref:SEFIR domain-containing protein n=1 Tax=Ditylenchus dipsaci TaxID=166011 RepID=A0A915DBG2_9BILA
MSCTRRKPPKWSYWSTVALIFLQLIGTVESATESATKQTGHTNAINFPADSYTHDCSDQHYKDILHCSVHIVDCETDTDELVPKVADGQLAPGEAHDIRIEPFAKALSTSRRQLAAASGVNGSSPAGDLPSNYQLTVDISWQTPPNNSTRKLTAFLLDIQGENGRKQACFLFNVSQSNWTAEAISSSPRLHFSTESVFRFSQHYDVTIYSLPESHSRTRSVHKSFSTPHNPVITPHNGVLLSPNCSQFSHPYASKWTAGFRRIFLHSLARTMQVEFVGAPPQYCFEQYEVRLLDETGLELLYSGIVTIEEMNREVINNSTVFFGEYNFTNLEMDMSYIPSVIPVERAHDGRCLCPVYGIDPYDNKVVCSCIAADYKPVRLTRLDVVQNDCPNCFNATIPPAILKPKEDSSSQWTLLLGMNLLCILFIICIAIAVFLTYRHYHQRGKVARIRFVQEDSGLYRGGAGGLENGNSAITSKIHLDNGVGLSQTPLLIVGPGSSLNILIVYSHDSKEHELAVVALGELLRDVFHMRVTLDCWEADRIECNMLDYLSASVLDADKVIVVNSRNVAGTLDHLFLAQIDMVLQHHSLLSIRFSPSSNQEILPQLQGCLQYVLPTNLTHLVSALVNKNLKQDPRLLGYSPPLHKLQTAIQALEKVYEAQPDWFLSTHHRRAIHPEGISRSQAQPPVSLPVATTGLEGTEELLLPIHSQSVASMLSSTASTSSVQEPVGDSSTSSNQEDQPVRQPSISLQMPQMMLQTMVEHLEEDEDENQHLLELEEAYCLEQQQPADSGVFDNLEEGMTGTEEQEEGLIRQETERRKDNIVVDSSSKPMDTLDSGMISDADLRMVSAT